MSDKKEINRKRLGINSKKLYYELMNGELFGSGTLLNNGTKKSCGVLFGGEKEMVSESDLRAKELEEIEKIQNQIKKMIKKNKQM